MSVNCGAFEILTRGLAVVDCIEDVSGVVTYVNLIVCTNEHLIFSRIVGRLVGLSTSRFKCLGFIIIPLDLALTIPLMFLVCLVFFLSRDWY